MNLLILFFGAALMIGLGIKYKQESMDAVGLGLMLVGLASI